jgi:hypothetical protein
MKRPKMLIASASAAVVVMALLVTTVSISAYAQRAANLVLNWTIVLRGPALNGATPVGNSDYEMEGSYRKFSAECDKVNLANGAELDVRVKGIVVGHIFLQDGGGALLLTGSRAPYIVRGTTVSINHHNGPTIVYGHF